MREIVDWGQAKKVKRIVSMGGIPVESRQAITEPQLFGAASNQELLEKLTKKGLSVMNEGYIVGPQALSMRYRISKNVPAIAILTQSFYNYPDPEAAAMVLKEFSRIFEIKVDVSKLREKG